MRKFLPLTAAIASAFAMGSAQASVILVDDFNVPVIRDTFVSSVLNAPVTHCYYKGAPSSCGGNGPQQQAVGTAQAAGTVSAFSLATQRDVSVTLTTNNGDVSDQTMEARVGGSPIGSLRVQAGNGNNGTANIQWTLPGFSIPANQTNYFFSILASTVGSTAPTLASFTFLGGAGSFNTAAQNIPASAFNASGTPLPFAVNVADAMKLAAGGVLQLNLTGGEGWSLQIDQFSFNVPEPTSLALVGLALIGAGVVSRRRKV